MNLSKRLQALRLLRRGEDIGHVAAALGISRREVELLVRVQEFSAKRAAGAG
jgi:DNA-binding NarL/FixJ family response regulator